MDIWLRRFRNPWYSIYGAALLLGSVTEPRLLWILSSLDGRFGVEDSGQTNDGPPRRGSSSYEVTLLRDLGLGSGPAIRF